METKSGLKHNRRSGLYSASNVSFDPNTRQAYSFVWWRFVDVIGGKVVFNNHMYSSYTSRHQGKVRTILHELGIKIDIKVDARCGLQNSAWKQAAINSLTHAIKEIEAKLANTRRKKALDEERVARLNSLVSERTEVQTFINSLEE